MSGCYSIASDNARLSDAVEITRLRRFLCNGLVKSAVVKLVWPHEKIPHIAIRTLADAGTAAGLDHRHASGNPSGGVLSASIFLSLSEWFLTATRSTSAAWEAPTWRSALTTVPAGLPEAIRCFGEEWRRSITRLPRTTRRVGPSVSQELWAATSVERPRAFAALARACAISSGAGVKAPSLGCNLGKS